MERHKLDKIDKKILFILDMNAREPVARIAKKIKASREVVDYRIKNLEKRGIIRGYYVVLDTSKLGLIFCRFFLKFHNIDEKKEKEIINYLKRHERIGWMHTIDGQWDLVFAMYARNIYEVEKLNDELFYKFSSIVANKYFSIATKIRHFRHNYLYGTNDYSQIVLGAGAHDEYGRIEPLDDADLKILELLAKDCKMPLFEIAGHAGASINTVKNKLKRLKDDKVILGFRTRLNTAYFGYEHYKVMMKLKNVTSEDRKKLRGYLRFHPNVIYITKSFIADLEFEIVIEGKRELYEIIREMRIKFPELIKEHDTMRFCDELMLSYLPDGCLRG